MQKVILITGASTGIGKETAKLFQAKNWRVAATMRSPEKADDLQRIADVECFRLDVTDVDSIKSAIAGAIEKFGRIDAVVNNAGYGLVGAFESASDEQIRRQFETNVFGLMNVTREILPYFREQRRGTIVNVASVGGRITFPLYSLYHATKWAVEGFSESLQYELEQFNIRIKIIEPGPIKTDFYDRSADVTRKEGLTVYDQFIDRVMPNMLKAGEDAPDGRVVADAVWNAVTDGSKRLRYNVNTKGMLFARRFLPEWAFFKVIKGALVK
ncbi:MAG: SDR family oxidoreductase [Acidobacteria bacterium]|nr:SDR family oxidoreductase [Acidobacteriota bacterium]